MASHRREGGRTPLPRDSASPFGDASSPGTSFSPQSSGSRAAQSVGRLPRTTRTASLSSAEENRQTLPPPRPSRPSSSEEYLPSSLPRYTGRLLPFNVRQRSCSNPWATMQTTQPSSSTLTQLDSSSSGTQFQTPVSHRPKRALRRKAPMIGRYDGSASQPETLGFEKPGMALVTAVPGRMADDLQQHRWDQPQLARQLHSSSTSKQEVPNRTLEDPANNGPKELASLRATTVDTQNLPPPPKPREGSPLTGYSDSPGLWSSVSTPTSLSSYSPGIFRPVKANQGLRQPSPSQPRISTFSPPLRPTKQTERGQQKSPGSRATVELADSVLPPTVDEHRRPSDAARFSASPPLGKPSMGFRSLTEAGPDAELSRGQEEAAESQAFEPLWKKTVTADNIYKVSSPSRPVREDVHQLELQRTPVIQGNLSSLKTAGHKRRESAEKPPTGYQLRPSGNREACAQIGAFRQEHTLQTPSHVAATPASSHGTAPNLAKGSESERDVKRTSGKQFGLFAKKSKSNLRGAISNQNKPNRKGPGAGTGHEGYGKYIHSGQRPSASSNSSRSIPSAKGKAQSRPDLNLDSFYLHRLDPVVISGGGTGTDGANLVRTQSEQSTTSFGLPSTSNHEIHTISQEHLDFDSNESRMSSKGTSAGFPSRNQHAQTEEANCQRNAMHTSWPNPIEQQVFSNAKIHGSNSKAAISHQSIGSHKSSNASLAHMSHTVHTLPSHEEESRSPPEEEELTSGGKWKGSRWNFFRRGYNTKRKNLTPAAPQHPVEFYAAASPVEVSRPFAHYALPGSGPDTLKDIPQRVNESPFTEEDEASQLVQYTTRVNSKEDRGNAIPSSPLFPESEGGFPKHEQPSSQALSSKDSETYSSVAERPRDIKQKSRLTPVGRIPQVVSSGERKHKPAVQSFSRPFSTADAPSLTSPVPDQLHDYNMPSHPTACPGEEMSPSQLDTVDLRLTHSSIDPAPRALLEYISGPYADDEFLALSTRRSSSSSGSDGANANLAAITAVFPQPGSETTEDEIWGEYDDFIEHISPKTMVPRDDSRPDEEEPFKLTNIAEKTFEGRSSTGSDVRAGSTRQGRSAENTVISTRVSGSSARPRRSRSPSTLRPSKTLSAQTYSGLEACDNGDRNADDTDRAYLDNTSPSVNFYQQPSSSAFSGVQEFETLRQQDNLLSTAKDRSRDRVADQANIRSGSLMTSRWLSFGRVLFSPAHKHVMSMERERILVFDGLGNDDWSFYCALTYPSAEIFNLSVDPSASKFTRRPPTWQPLQNHHTIVQPDLESPFTSPNGYFAAVILRFPAYCSEAAQSNLISECKRVLRSGGYLEMSLLDLDMVNMGVRTRKAVRGLKERTYMANASISLKPVSDSIQRLLGTHGFDNLRRCMVRIPVAGIIAGSSSNSSSSSNHSGSAPTTVSPAIKSPPTGGSPPPISQKDNNRASLKSSTDDPEMSLGDLLTDPSPSPSNDKSIAKTVAKVGRWWYSQCYEASVRPSNGGDDPHNNSIWADRKLLRECERQGTGFRLLIAYAQKPSEVPRRTASV